MYIFKCGQIYAYLCVYLGVCVNTYICVSVYMCLFMHVCVFMCNGVKTQEQILPFSHKLYEQIVVC